MMNKKWISVMLCLTMTFALTLFLTGCNDADSGDGSAPKTADQGETTGKYFSDIDWYNMLSSDTLTMLPHYRTYRQKGDNSGCSAVMGVLEWYGLRGDLNNDDITRLAGMQDPKAETPCEYVPGIFKNLEKKGVTGKWNITTSEDEPDMMLDSEWVQKELKAGHPIMVKWNSFGCHWQTIIGYETMGSEYTVDDVCIMMDSRDTTDGNNNGYYLEPYQRMLYGRCTEYGQESTGIRFVCACPEDWSYEQEMGEGPGKDEANKGYFSEDNKIPFGSAAEDIKKYYGKELKEGVIEVGKNGMAGPANDIYYHSFDNDNSPYYIFRDFYNMEDSDTLHMLTNFRTLQQATEYTCGPACIAMVMNWYGKLEDETDVSLMQYRNKGRLEAVGLKGMKEIFKKVNKKHDQDWVWVSTTDLDDPFGEESYVGDHCLQAGDNEEQYGLIPYLLDNDIPVIIGWDEWGGHWQVIIGYDDMGTKDDTEDDVIILADPYDTTDHDQDGYYVDSFKRLMDGYYADFEKKYNRNDFIAAFPAKGHEEVMKTLGIAD